MDNQLLISLIVWNIIVIGAFQAIPAEQQLQRSKWRSSSSKLSAKQILEFVEPETQVTVKLVGAMHYNPTSINLAKSTVEELADSEQLGSVIIESCDVRWNSSGDINPYLRELLRSEMGAASDVALEYNRPVILGDQRINITTSRMKAAFQETVIDMAQFYNGGWGRIASNITEAWKETSAPADPDNYYLNILSFFDPKLMLTAPVSFFKYPLSYVAKTPFPALSFLAICIFFFDPSQVEAPQLEWSDYVSSIGITLLETALFSRVIVKEVLAERNTVLAKSILEQCRLYTSETIVKNDPLLSESVYAPGCIPTTGDEEGKTVVAVLGMAHCNGIMKLLIEKEIL